MVTAQRLWCDRSLLSRFVRVALIPPSLVYRAVTAARSAAYRHGLLRSGPAGVPTISVGNLTVGGTGKTPMAAWIAAYCSGAGLKPGIVLRGYGGDEGAVHRRLVKDAIVVEDPNRVEAATRAIAGGADVIILDDAYQRFDIRRDMNIALVSAESMDAPRWTLPAGPWRESLRALKRADYVFVTRKSAPRSAADVAVRRVEREANCPTAVAHLAIGGFERLRSGARIEASQLSGADVVVAAGIANPETFADQLRELGASVRLVTWHDHQELSDRHLREFALQCSGADYGIVTEKDAVKMRERWPGGYEEPLVASLEVVWERGADDVRGALAEALNGCHR